MNLRVEIFYPNSMIVTGIFSKSPSDPLKVTLVNKSRVNIITRNGQVIGINDSLIVLWSELSPLQYGSDEVDLSIRLKERARFYMEAQQKSDPEIHFKAIPNDAV